MKKTLLLILLVMVVASAILYRSFSNCQINIIEKGTFIVLTITLVALIRYAYDTYRIANIAESRWERENILKATYYMEGSNDKGGSGRILFGINNPSILMLRAKIKCNFKVYNVPVEYSDDFNGVNTWYVFPQQISQGSYEIEPMLIKNGKTIEDMCREYGETNREQQLTMDLEIIFRDELNNERILPSRKVYFAFNDWRWVPVLTKKDDWV